MEVSNTLGKGRGEAHLRIPVSEPPIRDILDYPWFHLSPLCLSALVHSTYTLRPCCDKSTQIQEVFKGQESYLSNMPIRAGSWQQEKTASDFSERG